MVATATPGISLQMTAAAAPLSPPSPKLVPPKQHQRFNHAEQKTLNNRPISRLVWICIVVASIYKINVKKAISFSRVCKPVVSLV